MTFPQPSTSEELTSNSPSSTQKTSSSLAPTRVIETQFFASQDLPRLPGESAKVIGRKCSIHYVEEYSRRRKYNRTFDLWIWTDEPRAIPRGGTFAITSADEEGLATDIPLPDLEPLCNPPPSEPKKGWTYNVLVHVDTLEDLLSRKARAYKWDYDVQDDGTRYREYPLPCRAEPDPTRGLADDDEDKDRDNHSRSRHRSRSLWDRLRRRSSSRSREPDRRDGHRQDNENRGRPRNRERSEHRSRSCRSRDPSEDSLRSPSPDGGAAASPSLNQHIPDQSILQADSCFSSQGSEEVLTLLESHLDPMLHEATVQHSIYSPDTSSPRAVSPVFVPSFAVQGTSQEELAATQASPVQEFIAALSTPVQPPLLPAPETQARRPGRAKVTIPALSSAQRHSESLLRKRRAGAKLESFAQEILSKNFGIMDERSSFDHNIKKIICSATRSLCLQRPLKTMQNWWRREAAKAFA
ncbi:hypothetical protein OsI_38178 [Oryza sativa Indica Group]|uniref:Uncharacterized protein n=1 Tax=Oryza sativa subsp. indica TaxID=39946 RepID=B8BPE4_ORYSI|nr:hypothetical protein OsI_38178 [Oryza sativa Indica Group]